MTEKKEIRKKILDMRKKLSESFIQSNSNIIIEKLYRLIDKSNFRNIMIFMDMDHEVRVTNLLNLFSDRKFYIPKTFPEGIMKVNEYNEKELILHKFGYYESLSNNYVNEDILDLIVIPGIVFDKHRNRIGFGGGYYDRFLKKLKEKHKDSRCFPLTVAICYDFQLIDSIPSEPHDIKPDIIITERRVIDSRK